MSERVLIVDDERAIAQLTEMWMRREGYATEMAYSGQGGLDATAAHAPDLILLDIRMPDLDGFEVNRRLKKDAKSANIPVIFLSAHAQESARQEAVASGAARFLAKPCEHGDLIQAARAALANRVPQNSMNPKVNPS